MTANRQDIHSVLPFSLLFVEDVLEDDNLYDFNNLYSSVGRESALSAGGQNVRF